MKLIKNKVIDLNSYRKGSKPFNKTIDYCPKCNLKGEKYTLKNGVTVFTHSKKYNGFAFQILNECYILNN